MGTNPQAESLKAEGNKLVSQQNWRGAADFYVKATELDESCAVYWSNLAFCFDKLHNLDEYLAAAKRCVEVDPTFVKGYLRLANAYRRMRRYEDEKLILNRGLDRRGERRFFVLVPTLIFG